MADKPFALTPKQEQAQVLLGSDARHISLYGGSRSGKTFILVRSVCVRAIRSSNSSHVILRFKFNHLKASIIEQTLPAVMRICFPNIKYKLNRTDWVVEFPNGSRIWLGGLDDKDRTEKILGQEHSTIYLNEVSQISYDARNKAITRLAQKCYVDPPPGTPEDAPLQMLPLRAYYDCNPPTVGHWVYRLFEKKIEPKSGEALKNPERYVSMMMNPIDNLANLPAEYLEELEQLPVKDRKRFLEGRFLNQVDNALWTQELIDRARRAANQVPFLSRITVNVDPSGSQGEDDYRSDEWGVTVTGRDAQKRGYLLDDVSGRYSPKQAAAIIRQTYDKWGADIVIAEKNFGGALVEATIRAAWTSAPIKIVTASRGKAVRAEPVSLLYGDPNKPMSEQKPSRIFHVGYFPDLEEQLCNFSSAGYEGSRSPDRADSAIWGFTELLVTGSSYTLGNVA